eukprot:1161151-Pelagomonas_calceolata.AAC.4
MGRNEEVRNSTTPARQLRKLNAHNRHIQLIEINYRKDTGPGAQLEASQQQHKQLCKRLQGAEITLHTILLGSVLTANIVFPFGHGKGNWDSTETAGSESRSRRKSIRKEDVLKEWENCRGGGWCRGGCGPGCDMNTAKNAGQFDWLHPTSRLVHSVQALQAQGTQRGACRGPGNNNKLATYKAWFATPFACNAQTSHKPVIQTTWLKVTPHCNHRGPQAGSEVDQSCGGSAMGIT